MFFLSLFYEGVGMGGIIIFCSFLFFTFFGAYLNLDSVTYCSISLESTSPVPHLYAWSRHLLVCF